MNVEDREQKIALERRLRSLEPYPEGRFAGRGLVICAGGPALFTNAYVLVHVLRNALKCTLPIEVWHFGPIELSPRMAWLLHQLEVITVDSTARLAKQMAAIEDGWQLKIYALMESSFAQALLLDADIVPTRDPACVFDWAPFREAGTVLWPDVVDLLDENPIWEACGLEPSNVPSIESGQVLIDKAKCWRALQATLHLNERADYYYRFVYGDKDTWLMGLLMTGSRYAVVPKRPVADGSWGLYQLDFEGEVLFQHRTGAKWRYAGAQDELPGFQHSKDCAEALAQLRRDWNGIVFNAPARNAEALRIESEIARQSSFNLAVAGQPLHQLTLERDGEIGAGASPQARNWCCEVEGDEVWLVLHDTFGPRWRLKRDAAGRWRGHSLVDPAIEAELFAAPRTPAPVAGRARVGAQWPMSGSYSTRENAKEISS